MPKIISFESIECGGKSSQIKRLMELLAGQNIRATVKREPGGTPYGEVIRNLLKYPKLAIPAIEQATASHGDAIKTTADSGCDFSRTPECELFLFLASRAEFADKVIGPALRDGYHVIADRLYDSTRAYQGGGRFHNDPAICDFIDRANAVAMRGFIPTKTILLDISIETMHARLALEHPDKIAVFEEEDRAFFERTRQAYHDIAKKEPDRFIVIDAEKSKEEVFQDVVACLRPILDIK